MSDTIQTNTSNPIDAVRAVASVHWSVSTTDKSYFLESFATLLLAGRDVFSALRSIENDARSKPLKKILSAIVDVVGQGVPVWQCIEASELFSSRMVSLIRIGEQTGKLAEHIRVVAVQEARERSFRQKFKSAMMYPMFVFGLLVIVGTGVAWFILPKLANIFSSLRIDLPVTTRILIAIGTFLQKNGVWAVPLFLFVCIALIIVLFVLPKTKHIGQGVLVRMPAIGTILKDVELSRFGFLLSSLIGIGFSTPDAMLVLRDSTLLRTYQRLYGAIAQDLAEGLLFAESFAKQDPDAVLLPSVVQQLIIAGEQSRGLEDIFMRVHQMYDERVDQSTKNLTVLLEPVLLLLVAGGVFFIAISVLMPIYGLVSGVRTAGQPPAPKSVSVRTQSQSVSRPATTVPSDTATNTLYAN